MTQLSLQSRTARILAILHPSRLIAGVLFLLAGTHLWAINRFALDVPIGDEWEAFSERNSLGGFNLSWILSQHNEHRIIPTKIQVWLNYWWNNFDVRTQICQNFLIFTVVVLVFVLVLHRLRSVSLPLLLMSSVFLFSTRPSENHAWGFQSQFHFVLLFSIAACGVLFQQHLTRAQVLVGSSLALLAIYSFSSGVPMVLAMGGVFAAFLFYRVFALHEDKKLLRSLLVFGGMIIAGLAVYFSFGYHKVEGHPAYTLPTDSFFWAYYLRLIANGFGGSGNSSWEGGVFLGITLLPIAFLLRRQLQSKKIVLDFWLLASLCSIVLGSLGAIAMGRAGFGLAQARSSRYAEFSSFLVPIAIVSWAAVINTRTLYSRIFLGLLLFLFLHLYRKSWHFQATYQEVATERLEGIECLKKVVRTGQRAVCPSIYPADLWDKLEVARELEASFYRKLMAP